MGKTNPNKANLSRRSLWRRRNKAKFKKAKMNVTVFYIKDYENISNWAIYENKANFNPKQTQLVAAKPLAKPDQRQKNAALHLFAVGGRTEKIKYEFETAHISGNEP